MGRFSLVGVMLVLFSSSGVSAEFDRSEFPENLRAMEWRDVGSYRGGRFAAVAGIYFHRFEEINRLSIVTVDQEGAFEFVMVPAKYEVYAVLFQYRNYVLPRLPHPRVIGRFCVVRCMVPKRNQPFFVIALQISFEP